MPVVMKSTNIHFKQLIYTPKRIFALVDETTPKFWFKKKWDTLFNNNDSDTNQITYIKVYNIR